MPLNFAASADGAIPIELVEKDQLKAKLAQEPTSDANWLTASGFEAGLCEVALLPDANGGIARVICGLGTASDRARVQFPLGRLRAKLPAGTYRLADERTEEETYRDGLGWLLSGYRFRRYRKGDGGPLAELAAPETGDELLEIAHGVALTRDLINTPTNDMGPDELEAAIRDLAGNFGAEVEVTKGADLLKQNFPMIHAVGRASDKEPRLVDMRWGPSDGPKITLVGKGVCFDTGGLNIKPGNSMSLMKKDMGGAATTIGLAHMIMSAGLPVQLRLLVPAVENSISAGAFRPGDILTSRKGLTVEINNTDAEGRLVLADALALADEENPDLTVCMATLTGAARVALGPEVIPYYTDENDLAEGLADAAKRVADPLWRMPLWPGYESVIEPGIADLDNAPAGGFGGSITAALFLRRFVENAKNFVHFDVYGWTPAALPARPKGGESQAARAVFDYLQARYV